MTQKNLAEHPQAIYFMNAKSKFNQPEVDRLAGQFKRGLGIKMLYVEGVKRAVGFIEYVPGEHCRRRVDGKEVSTPGAQRAPSLYGVFSLIRNGRLPGRQICFDNPLQEYLEQGSTVALPASRSGLPHLRRRRPGITIRSWKR